VSYQSHWMWDTLKNMQIFMGTVCDWVSYNPHKIKLVFSLEMDCWSNTLSYSTGHGYCWNLECCAVSWYFTDSSPIVFPEWFKCMEGPQLASGSILYSSYVKPTHHPYCYHSKKWAHIGIRNSHTHTVIASEYGCKFCLVQGNDCLKLLYLLMKFCASKPGFVESSHICGLGKYILSNIIN